MKEEKKMAKKDYSKLAKNLIADVGGQSNIDSYFHCATRMRFQLKDINKAKSNTDKVKELSLIHISEPTRPY